MPEDGVDLTEEEKSEAEKRERKRRSLDVAKFRFQTTEALVDGAIKTIDIQLDGRLIRKIWKSLVVLTLSDLHKYNLNNYISKFMFQFTSRINFNAKRLICQKIISNLIHSSHLS